MLRVHSDTIIMDTQTSPAPPLAILSKPIERGQCQPTESSDLHDVYLKFVSSASQRESKVMTHDYDSNVWRVQKVSTQ